MNHKLKGLKSKAMFTFVGGMLVINPAFAQDPAPQEPVAQSQPAGQDASTLDTIVVTGLRNSLENSMGIKRDTSGVVDAISAEDIGKFPDTNLAESLQRITGISIERRNGEGAQITARGFGPGYNLVTLNGRQIPGADAYSSGDVITGGVGAGTRGFNFAQLASEAISGITVFKTGRAHAPSGGMGATVDIQTTRPLNLPSGLTFNAGMKAMSDESQTIGSSITPELSSIVSWASDDKRWGASLSTSFQHRKGGEVQATENEWRVQPWTGTPEAWGDRVEVINAPAVGSLYSVPADLRYAFSNFERKRVNAQATLQFAPTDAVTFTLDYTHSTNELTEDRGEQTQWLNQGPFSRIEFDTSGAVAVPTYIREIVGTKDFGYEQQRNEQKYKLDSIGFNVDWQVTDRLNLNFDAHSSETKSLPNDPITGGSVTAFSFAGTSACQSAGGPYCGGNWAQEYWFNTGLPIMARTWYPESPNANDAFNNVNGVVNPEFPPEQIGTQIQRIWYSRQDSKVEQGRIDGTFDFDNSRLRFGVDSSKVSMRRLTSNDHQTVLGNWSVDNVGEEPGFQDLIRPINISGMFNDYNTDGAPHNAWWGNASQLAQWASGFYGTSSTISGVMANDNLIEEKTSAAYVQWEFDGQLGTMPYNLVLGARYEQTDLRSVSTIQVPQSINWNGDNDFAITPSAEEMPFAEEAEYNYWLPNLDFSIDFTSSLKGRLSLSQTIARAPYGNLYAGPTAAAPNGSVLLGFRATGAAQNPGLLPLESDNIDVALEWYFAPASYVSLTFFDKRVNNFIGNTQVQENLYGLRDPTGGPDAQAALAFLTSPACRAQVGPNAAPHACGANAIALFTAAALQRHADVTGGLAAYDGTDAQWNAMEALVRQPGREFVGIAEDPLYMFNVNRPVNQRKANIHGWELGSQYFFGDSGFGIQANYTKVSGDVGIDDAAAPGVEQFALTGLSDTANVVFMYEKYGWTARLAWNWRDEYLFAANQGNSTNPFYVEDYQQWDFSVTKQLNDNWSVGLEAINLTGEDVRWRARTNLQMLRLLDQSPRYMAAVRYTF
ncbi:TonB-dependent receptor [Luteimonas wenzhouensis]|uniref:TonB-dependent receptor n=1 Tax=Luteimonas wenzhouensis TaxID=2599615 RepID=A0A5C5U1B8_9GAMM|nr:TonB-dependent receptor [Luteimonas wenzhouensis]TWT19499.1 TonB-dependent receptor [Luteimonas wenzhouensis]